MSHNDMMEDPPLRSERETVLELMDCLSGAPTASILRRTTLLLLRSHYAHPGNYSDEFAHLKCYKWSSDKKDSTLPIDFMGAFDDNDTAAKPGIWVGYTVVTPEKLAIGDYVTQSADNSRTDTAKRAKLQIVINHVGKTPNDSFDMAEMTFLLLTGSREFMMSNLKLADWSPAAFGDIVKSKEAPDRYYKVAVRLEVSYDLGVSISMESHRLKKLIHELHPDNNPASER